MSVIVKVLRTLRVAVLLAATACGGGSSGGGSMTGSSTGGGTGTSAPERTDVLTYHYDTARSGANLTETVLTPANVNSNSFGLLRTLAADGLVDAAPIVVTGVSINGGAHTVVYVASEHDSVYAYDADDGTMLKQVSLLPSGETPSDDRGCGQVAPEIGITSTPVVDKSQGPNGTLFVVAMSKDSSGGYHQRVHALDLASLADRMPATLVQGAFPGAGPNSSNGQLSFEPGQYKERGALLLTQGQLITVWGSHCDISPYNVWIMGYRESSLTQTQVLNLTPNGSMGSIWHVSGLAVDSGGALYGILANGSFDTTLAADGMPGQGDYGNAAVRLSISTASNSLAVTDYFTPFNTHMESAEDQDFGSGSPMVLPDQTDTAGNTQHLLFTAGKDGAIYLLDRDNMGKYASGGNQIYQELAGALGGGGLFSAPAYFNGTVYVGPNGGPLYAYAFDNARLSATPSSKTSAAFSYPGTSPSVSADGTSNAIVWAIQSSAGSAAVLHAYNPTNLAEEYYNSAQAASQRDAIGNGNKYITPVVADGKVLVGTPTGVAVFGLLK